MAVSIEPDESSRNLGVAAPTGGVDVKVSVRVPAGSTIDPTVCLDLQPADALYNFSVAGIAVEGGNASSSCAGLHEELNDTTPGVAVRGGGPVESSAGVAGRVCIPLCDILASPLDGSDFVDIELVVRANVAPGTTGGSVGVDASVRFNTTGPGTVPGGSGQDEVTSGSAATVPVGKAVFVPPVISPGAVTGVEGGDVVEFNFTL